MGAFCAEGNAVRGVLVTLPLQDPSVPQLGTALLAAALEESGAECVMVDANHDFLNILAGASPFTDEAYQTSRGYMAAYRQLRLRLGRHGSPGGAMFLPFQIRYACWPDVNAVRRLSRGGLWQGWLRAGVVERILRHEPDWVGLSVSFEGQLAPAMALGAALKGRAFVLWGGGLLNAFRHVLAAQTPIWDAADAVVLGAGEGVLAHLRRSPAGLRPPDGSRVARTPGGWIAQAGGTGLEAARLPSFGCLSARAYCGAERVLPYRVFGSCHWRRCAFCADVRYRAHRDRLGGDPEAVALDLCRLRDTYQARGIYFLDAELPAAFALPLSAQLAGSGLRWGGNARLEPAFARPGAAERLYAGGCRFLRFGLESASPSVLGRMRKGIALRTAERVLHAVSQAGIGVHVYLMQGFPGETREDLMATRKFLLTHVRDIDSYNVSTFAVYEGAPLVRSLAASGILVRDARPDWWSTPRMAAAGGVRLDLPRLEEEFYSRKGPTRCFPTTGDSIMLGERFLLDFRD